MAGRHAGHDKTWKSVALGLDYVASGAHIHEQIMANLGCPAKKNISPGQRDPEGMINHAFRTPRSIILAIVWVGDVEKLMRLGSLAPH